MGIGCLWKKNILINFNFGQSFLYFPKAYRNSVKYQVQGKYGYLSIGYLVKYDKKNNLYLSLGFGRSSYEAQGKFIIKSKFALPYTYILNSSNPIYTEWVFLSLGSEKKIFSFLNFYSGFCFQIKKKISRAKHKNSPFVYYIPGYGIAKNRYNMAFKLYFAYKFNFLLQENF